MDRKKNLEIIVLNQISHAIVHQRQASDLIREVLDILYHEMGLKRGTITLRHDDVLYIEASNGLSNE
ncbi:MAG: sigma-54-dependent Fis family transcriptional regulator, partial [Lentisphaeria bacterium]|nr:sigma-54-dependent Fis family transcriptional regulator [Lentisphaeria bacterium]